MYTRTATSQGKSSPKLNRTRHYEMRKNDPFGSQHKQRENTDVLSTMLAPVHRWSGCRSVQSMEGFLHLSANRFFFSFPTDLNDDSLVFWTSQYVLRNCTHFHGSLPHLWCTEAYSFFFLGSVKLPWFFPLWCTSSPGVYRTLHLRWAEGKTEQMNDGCFPFRPS